jgi:cullin 1
MTSPTLTIYKDFFEIYFLHDTEQFYQFEAATFLVHNSVTEYLKKVCLSSLFTMTNESFF